MERELNMETAGRSGKIRVMLVDGHAGVRDGIRGILACTPDIEVCAETGHAQEALELARTHRPDVVVMEVDLGQDDGLELTRTLRVSFPALRAVVFTNHEEIFYADEAVVSGARAFVGKTQESAVLVDAIRQVAAGDFFFPEELLQHLLGELCEKAAMPPAPRAASGRRQQAKRVSVGQGSGCLHPGGSTAVEGSRVRSQIEV
jgi:DNA-binding NarL/FixJ family response regulator